MLDAVLAGGEVTPVAFWRDTPYVTRVAHAALDPRVAALDEVALPVEATLSRKLDAVACYGSQLGFQFGGDASAIEAIRTLSMREGGGVAAERFRATPAAMRLMHG